MDMVLYGDQHRILQVMINLVSNSLKFTPEHGKVEVRIRCVAETSNLESPSSLKSEAKGYLRSRYFSPFSANNSPDHASDTLNHPIEERISAGPELRQLTFQFEVEDNGPGIPHHLHRRIFDPFVQGDLGLNRKYGGTGLGLSICAQLSRIMGGDILLESEEGEGATFTLRIPLRFVKEQAHSTHNSSTPGSRTPSVLSLEDFSNAARTPSNQGSLKSESVAPGFEKSDIQPRLVGLSQPFFTPTVPSSAPSPPSKLSQPGQNADEIVENPKKIHVLVAEDNTVNQEVVRRYDRQVSLLSNVHSLTLTRMLALEDVYDVTMVKDGQEAYDTVKSHMERGNVFDLIFMDIQVWDHIL